MSFSTRRQTTMLGTMKKLKASNDALNEPEELRRRLAEDGYLYLRRIQDPEKLLALRREVMEVLMGVGWLAEGTDPMDGIARIDAQCTEGDPEYVDGYH